MNKYESCRVRKFANNYSRAVPRLSVSRNNGWIRAEKSLANRVVTLVEKLPGKESQICGQQMGVRKLSSFVGLSFWA